MRERDVEKRLVIAARNAGGIAPKLVCPGRVGMPDRLLLLPGGKLAFVEVKAPGMKPRPIQRKRIQELERLGFRVYVVDEPEQIEDVVTRTARNQNVNGGDAQ